MDDIDQENSPTSRSFSDYCLFALAFLIPLLPFLRAAVHPALSATKEIIVLCACTYSAGKILLNRRLGVVPVNFGIGLALIFVGYCFIHVLISNRGLNSSLDSARYILTYPVLTLFIYFASGAMSIRYEDILLKTRAFLFVSFLSAFVVALVGLYEKYINQDFSSLYGQYELADIYLGFGKIRIVSTLENPINLGFFMVVGVAIALFLWKNEIRVARKIFFFCSVLLFSYIALLTLSRGAILAMFLLFAFLFCKTILTGNMKSKAFSIIIAALVCLSVLVLRWQLSGTELGFLDILVNRLFELGNSIQSGYDPRTLTWQSTLFPFLQNSNFIEILFGKGLGNIGWTNDLFLMENGYFSLIYELGVLGLCIFISILIKFIYNAIILSFYQDKIASTFGDMLQLFLITYILSLVTADYHMGLPFIYYFWVLYGLSEMLIHAKEKSPRV